MLRDRELEKLKDNAGEAADFLWSLANDKRLLILCELMAQREVSVGDLADVVGLSQSALSQHLSKLRAENLVQTRRESQTIFYRLSSGDRVKRTLSLLKKLFCQ